MSFLLAFVLSLFLHLRDGSAGLQSAPVAQQHVVADTLPNKVASTSQSSHAVPTRPPVHAHAPKPVPAPAPAPVPALVPAPGPDSPVCEAGQTPAVDGCAQGQLPEETTGRAYG